VPGRDIFVQAWYQGGISVMDFTDSSNPVEIAFFDRGPVDEKELILGGYWSAYWYAGRVFGTEIARGLDVLSLSPSDYLSANEIAAASYQMPGVAVNAQQQTRHEWPAEPAVALAYIDQLARSELLAAEQETEMRELLGNVETLLLSEGKDPLSAVRLEGIAGDLREEGVSRSGISAKRFDALATSIEELAERIR
tara:strand:+ start:78 stop:662 length:585 start_codon:yes stop_codon:yes gene_type:complete